MSELNHNTQPQSSNNCHVYDSSSTVPHGIPQMDLDIPLDHCLTLSSLLYSLSDLTTRPQDKSFCRLYAHHFEMYVRHWLSAIHLSSSSSPETDLLRDYLIDLQQHFDRSRPGLIVGEK